MVDVPVDDGDLLQAPLIHGMPGGQGNVVEVAVATNSLVGGVVTWTKGMLILD